MNSRRAHGSVVLFPLLGFLLAAASAHAADAGSPESAISAGLATAVVGPLGPFEGGLAVEAQAGWSPLPGLRMTGAIERAVFIPGKIFCDCAEFPCCVGANAPYTWLGVGLEGHATPRRLIDVYSGAEVGAVVRNAWRAAAKVKVGFDVRIKIVAVGLFGGVMIAASDSLFNENANHTFTAGVRAMVVLPR